MEKCRLTKDGHRKSIWEDENTFFTVKSSVGIWENNCKSHPTALYTSTFSNAHNFNLKTDM